jgi:putative thiamine transport system ATP-binding protein
MLSIKNLCLALGQDTLFDHFNLFIEPGEIVTLAGASGSGKSTLLNWLIGDLDPAFKASGELWLNDQRLDALPVEKRGIGLLFQDDLLFAHLSVGQNLGFALPARIKGNAVRRQHIEASLGQIGLAGFYERDPTTLSGGQKARVSVMRALLANPKAILLDEPFSKLDLALRLNFRDFVYEQIKKLSIPALLVTHDPADSPTEGRVIKI